jgi:phage antirepressor YoqD-like protein
LDDDEKGVDSIYTRGGDQELLIVNEPGLYALVLGSRKPEAKAFRRWITHEVIPAIRKHGGYLTPQAIEQFLDNPDLIVEMALKMKAEREKCEMLECELLAAKPKVEYFNDLVDRETLTGIRETAKELDWSERNFTRYLVDNGFAYRDKKSRLQPYAKHVEDGLFVLKECKSNRNSWSGTQMMITPKGRETLRLLMCG